MHVTHFVEAQLYHIKYRRQDLHSAFTRYATCEPQIIIFKV